MELNAFIQELKKQNISYRSNEPMCSHTTFRIGGTADVWVTADSEKQLSEILAAADRFCVPVFLIGRGSNLLVSDRGIRGAVISLSGLNSVAVSGERIICGAGKTLAALCTAARDAGLSGLEFAYGIPGSVGGAVFMNAGAYGGEMSQVVETVQGLYTNGSPVTVSAKEMQFGYRSSLCKSAGIIVTGVTLHLKKSNPVQICARMEELLARRREKQPLEYPSAGSIFKRPKGYYAGTLIEQNGLKGAAVGGAAVSEKHAGFIINKGGATCGDVCELIRKIRQTVKEHDSVSLETEVLFIGEQEGTQIP